MKSETQLRPIPAAAAVRPPLPDAAPVERAWRQALSKLNRCVVVLDDDPTGIQTVHGLYVYTDWSRETFVRGLTSGQPMFFVLTNSRSLSAEETRAVHMEIAEHLAQASLETGWPFLLVSRGDSTLRGHYPLETETLRQTLEAMLPLRYSGEILMPYFQEGGRFTIGDVHYVRTGEQLVPAGMTEFARDSTFPFSSSDLKDWCEERTKGRYPAGEVASISLEELRGLDYGGIVQTLSSLSGFRKLVVNCAHGLDAEVFVTALVQALEEGKEFLIRSAAGLVRALSGVEPRPLLTREELRGADHGTGGLVVVGSHVAKTTGQLERLLREVPHLEPICFQAERVLQPDGGRAEEERVLACAERAIRAGTTAVIYTSRQVLVTQQGGAGDLALSTRISRAVSRIVAALSVRPAFLIAKGGITSSDIGVHALGVKRALILGQAAPGVPVWQTGPESKFPGLSYIIFPGNVGEPDTLCRLVRRLL